jgi:AcrR family transcriptional regulator
LDADGPEELSLRGLARAAGVSPNAPYRHFKDRQELLSRLAARGFRQLVSRFDERSGLTAMGQAYVDFAVARPEMYRLMFGPPLRDCRIDDPADELGAASKAAFDRLTEAAGSHEAALAYWALTHGWAELLISGLTKIEGAEPPPVGRLLELLREAPEEGA